MNAIDFWATMCGANLALAMGLRGSKFFFTVTAVYAAAFLFAAIRRNR